LADNALEEQLVCQLLQSFQITLPTPKLSIEKAEHPLYVFKSFRQFIRIVRSIIEDRKQQIALVPAVRAAEDVKLVGLLIFISISLPSHRAPLFLAAGLVDRVATGVEYHHLFTTA
jgi:hypothetical protein